MPPTPAPPDDAWTLGPPAAHCTVEEPAPQVAFVDNAPVTVASSPKGVALDTSGASAGRVLAAIAAQAKKGIDARGPGAAVRIYAHVKDQPVDALIKLVADAAGLDIVPPVAGDTSGITVVQDARAAREESRRERAIQLATAPLETRLVPAKHAGELAPVIAMTLLTCRGRVTGVVARHLVAVTDVHEVLEHVSALVAALDTSPPKPLSLSIDPPRVSLWGARAQRCGEVPLEPAPSALAGGPGRLSAEGTAAGDLLVRVARVQNEDVVVGCGGDRPAYFSPSGASPKTTDVARALGLSAVEAGVYASADLAPAAPLVEDGATVAAFVTHDARELASVADDIVGDPAAAVPYEPASLLVVSASPSDVARVKELVDAWATR
jgi:hypothetical protein